MMMLTRRFTGWLALLPVLGAISVAGNPTNTTLQIESASVDPEGRQRFELHWNALSNAIYRIQYRSSLAPGVPWETIDVVTPEAGGSGSGFYQFAAVESIGGYFQLLVPEPGIFSIEPARFPLGGPTDLYVIGQCFGPDTELRVGQQGLPAFEIVHPGLMRGSFTPLVPDTYVFELTVQGSVVSSFAVECFDPAAPPPSVLQEPPDEPWASPVAKGSGEDMVVMPTGLHGKPMGSPPGGAPNGRVTPSGEVELDEVDMFVPGRGLHFVWGRRYRSRSGPDTGQGNRWDYSYNVSARQVAGGMEVHDGMGRADVFARNADGTFTRDEHFSIGSITGGVFRLTFADTGYWEFRPFDGAPSEGKLERIVDRNHNTMRLEHDVAGRLVRVVDTLNRVHTISYGSPQGEIASITDFTGRRVTYEYYPNGDMDGNPGDLKSVTTPAVIGTPNGNDFPNGKRTLYTYSTGFADPRENSLLLSVTDPRGQTAHRYVYQHNPSDLEFLRCTSRQVGAASDRIVHSYQPQTPAPSNQFATMKVIVNDRAGNVSESSFDARHRLLLRREFTGRASLGMPTTETANRPVNKLRASDPDFFETRFEWNNDSLCTRIVHPRGNETSFLYERDFNPAAGARKKGDLRVLRELTCCPLADVDRDGLPDLAVRDWRFEYDPRFGSPRLRGGDGQIDPPSGGTRTIKNPDAIVAEIKLTPPPPTLSTDPNGNTTTEELDSQGNRTRHTGPFVLGNDAPVVEYAYNAFGQCTNMIHPADGEGRRSVDVFEYYDSGPQNGYLQHATRDHHLQGAQDVTQALRTSYEYDDRGNLTRRVDPRGNDTLFTYNALDQVVAQQSPPTDFVTQIRYATTFAYDANDNLVRVDHENRDDTGTLDPGNPLWTTSYEYDVLDRRTQVVRELSHTPQQGGQTTSTTNRFHYDANDNLIRVELPEAVSGADPNNVVTHAYDERDLLFESVAAPGTGMDATTRFDYDGNGNLVRSARGSAQTVKESRFAYDGLDRLSRVTDAMGNEELHTYDANGNLVRRRLMGEMEDQPGSAGNVLLTDSLSRYDSLDRVTHHQNAWFDTLSGHPVDDGESTTAYDYAPNSLLLSQADDNGHTTRFTYDTAHRLVTVTDPGLNTAGFTYDDTGNLLSRVQTDISDLGGNPLAFAVVFEYDGLNRRTSATDNLGNNENWAFDSRGNVVRHTDPRGNDTTYAYDGLNRLTDVAEFTGQATPGNAINTSHVEYRNNRRAASTDGNGNTTQYAYDALDRRIQVTQPDGTPHVFVWDAFGNLGSLQDANGSVVIHTYDLLDRCVRKDITPAQAQGVAATTTFEEFAYDGASRLIRTATDDPSGPGQPFTHTFVWDSLSNPAGQGQTVGGMALEAAATFDGVGNRLSLIHPSGLEMSSTYDALDRLTSVGMGPNSPPLPLATFGYDGPGRLALIARPNGVDTRINWSGDQNVPNQPGDFGWQRVARIDHHVAVGGASIDTRMLAYDRSQNKILRAQTLPFTAGGLLRTNLWDYDPLDRLQSSAFVVGKNPPSTRQYMLDSMGNRQSVLADGRPEDYLRDNTLPEPADFQMNQYTLSPLGGHHYDLNGNLLMTDAGAGPVLYQYDYADRLVSVQVVQGPVLLAVAEYAYDALGRRVSKTIHPPPPLGPVTTRFFYDGNNCIEERVEGAVSRSYFIPEIDDEVLVAFNAGGQAQYHHYDDLGNALALTDAAGNVIERYEYDDFGRPQFLDAKGDPLTDPLGLPVTESPAGNPYLFHGMYRDAETALYEGAYDPATGGHIIRAGSVNSGNNDNWNFNGRSFAGNNPWTGRDLRGQTMEDEWTTERERRPQVIPTFAGGNPWSGGIMVNGNGHNGQITVVIKTASGGGGVTAIEVTQALVRDLRLASGGGGGGGMTGGGWDILSGFNGASEDAGADATATLILGGHNGEGNGNGEIKIIINSQKTASGGQMRGKMASMNMQFLWGGDGGRPGSAAAARSHTKPHLDVTKNAARMIVMSGLGSSESDSSSGNREVFKPIFKHEDFVQFISPGGGHHEAAMGSIRNIK